MKKTFETLRILILIRKVLSKVDRALGRLTKRK